MINSNLNSGGAATSFFRLFYHLKKAGHDVNMLVMNNSSKIDKVYNLSKSKVLVRKIVLRLSTFYLKKKSGLKSYFSQNIWPSNDLLKMIDRIQPDIIHLKWINSEMLSIKSISKIKIPIVWTLADMWAFTGGCHYTNGCERYKSSCGKCPILNSKKEYDITSKLLQMKIDNFKAISCVVGQSIWMTNQIKSSKVFSSNKVVNIPNGLDSRIFKKKDRLKARKRFKLNSSRNLLLYGAMNSQFDNRKGYDLLIDSLSKVESSFDIAIFGTFKRQEYVDDNGRTVYELGQIKNEYTLVEIYNAADVMVVPSREDNFPNTILESLMCSTPVVSFNIGGIPDLINHKVNGYLARPYSTDDLASGIDWILNNQNYQKISESARENTKAKFDINHISERYLELYNLLQE